MGTKICIDVDDLRGIEIETMIEQLKHDYDIPANKICSISPKKNKLAIIGYRGENSIGRCNEEILDYINDRSELTVGIINAFNQMGYNDIHIIEFSKVKW